jgi:AraC family transcriptional regulator
MATITEGPAEYLSRRSHLSKRRLSSPRMVIDLLDYEVADPYENELLLPDRYLLNFRLGRQRPAYGRVPDLDGDRRRRFGDLNLLLPNTRVQFSSKVDRVSLISCLFDGRSETLQDGGLIGAWEGRAAADAFDVRESHAAYLMRRLAEVIVTDDFGSRIEAEYLSMMALVAVIRKIRGRRPGPSSGGLAPWQLARIDERIRAEASSPPSLAELAATCRISERHLTRAYRQARGSSIGDLVRDVQIEEAQRRLREGEPVATIAAALGFGSSGSFAKAFRRRTGAAPRDYRRRLVGARPATRGA